MKDLKPFVANLPTVELQAEIARTEWGMRIEFQLRDPSGVVKDSLVAGHWASWDRANELWKTTCFEAFWRIPGQAGYWELNLSPACQKWNCYSFDGYRDPQPPRACRDFVLREIITSRESLVCELVGEFASVEFSLCAVIRTDGGPNYFSLAHASEKADFHAPPGFILRR